MPTLLRTEINQKPGFQSYFVIGLLLFHVVKPLMPIMASLPISSSLWKRLNLIGWCVTDVEVSRCTKVICSSSVVSGLLWWWNTRRDDICESNELHIRLISPNYTFSMQHLCHVSVSQDSSLSARHANLKVHGIQWIFIKSQMVQTMKMLLWILFQWDYLSLKFRCGSRVQSGPWSTCVYKTQEKESFQSIDGSKEKSRDASNKSLASTPLGFASTIWIILDALLQRSYRVQVFFGPQFPWSFCILGSTLKI